VRGSAAAPNVQSRRASVLLRAFFIALAALVPGALPAQDTPPAGPPASSHRAGGGEDLPELLPDIGRIGAQVAIFSGASFNPFESGRGWDIGGYIDLPLRRVPKGRLSYEIYLNESLATSAPFTITDSVAVVANLAAGAPLAAALAGPPKAPFPVTREVRADLHMLQVAPFGLRYTIEGRRLSPFFGAGLDFFAVITSDIPQQNESLLFNGSAPFDAALIAGLIGQAPELTARHTPTGQGNIDVGGHGEAGVEIKVGSGLSLNLEYRLTLIGDHAETLQTVNAALGFHW
jgi:hypothetical protein